MADRKISLELEVWVLQTVADRKISLKLSEIANPSLDLRSDRFNPTAPESTVGLKRSDLAGHIMIMCDAGGRRTPTAAGVTYVYTMARMSSSRWALKPASTIIDYSACGSFAGEVVLWLVVHRRDLHDSSD